MDIGVFAAKVAIIRRLRSLKSPAVVTCYCRSRCHAPSRAPFLAHPNSKNNF